MSVIVDADYSVARPAEDLPAVLPVLVVVVALVVGLLAFLVRHRRDGSA